MSNELPILFAVETTVRELDARLVLSALYGRRRHKIFIAGGPSGQRLLSEIPNALFVGKHVIHPTASDPRAYFEAKRNGITVVHLAEEGGVFMGEEADWAWDLDDQLRPSMLEPEDFVCTWGDFQRDHYRAKGALNPANIRTTGHPRFDIYKTSLRKFYEDEARALRERYGDFVIWCSNFGLVNDPEGAFNTFSAQLGYVPENEEQRRRFIGRWSGQARAFAEFIELFHRLSLKHRHVTFVVRPHPSDNVQFFKLAFAGVPNIKVIQEGTVVPWLLAARAMLHDGCTTGLEAHMVGCPIINFKPYAEAGQSFYLPNLFGETCRDQEEALAAVSAAVGRPRDESVRELADVPERAHKIFSNFRNDSFDLFFRVMREAEDVARRRPFRAIDRTRVDVNEARDIAVEEGKNALRWLVSKRRYRTAMHGRQRFPGFDREAIGRKLSKLEHLTGNKLECRFHSRNLLELTPSRAGD